MGQGNNASVVDRLRAFGLPLLAALLVLAGSLWALGLLIDETIREGEVRTDERVADWLHGRATDPFTDVFRAITTLGNSATLIVVVVIAVAALATRRAHRRALRRCRLPRSTVLASGMKLGFRRERPFFGPARDREHVLLP